MPHPIIKINELSQLVIDHLLAISPKSLKLLACTYNDLEEQALAALWSEQSSLQICVAQPDLPRISLPWLTHPSPISSFSFDVKFPHNRAVNYSWTDERCSAQGRAEMELAKALDIPTARLLLARPGYLFPAHAGQRQNQQSGVGRCLGTILGPLFTSVSRNVGQLPRGGREGFLPQRQLRKQLPDESIVEEPTETADASYLRTSFIAAAICSSCNI